MKKPIPQKIGCRHLLGLITIAANSQAVTYDLNAGWSDSINPNGVWTYREGTNVLPHVNSFQGLAGDFASAQPAWARFETGDSFLPGWFKSTATVKPVHDWLPGDVVIHSTSGANGVGSGAGNVTWTSPINGSATIAGSVWMGRDIGRANHWALLNDATLITEGDIASGDPFDRNLPATFSAGSRGPLVLQNIPVSIGEEFELRITKTGEFGDYAGVNFQVTTIPSPNQPDTDGDGMSDAFEQKYFGSPVAGNPAQDNDGDGSSNLGEFLAGTNPLDPESVFKIISIARDPAGKVTFTFPGVLGKTYRAEYADTPAGAPWVSLLSNIPGIDGVIPITDSNPGPSHRFYRVVLP